MSGFSGYGRRPAHPSHRPYVPLARRTSTLGQRIVDAGRESAVPMPGPAPVDDVTPHLEASIFATDPELVALVEVIAEALHRAHERLDHVTPADAQRYSHLPDDQKRRLRAHAIACVQALSPWTHAAALGSAARTCPNLDRGLEHYIHALKRLAPLRMDSGIGGRP